MIGHTQTHKMKMFKKNAVGKRVFSKELHFDLLVAIDLLLFHRNNSSLRTHQSFSVNGRKGVNRG